MELDDIKKHWDVNAKSNTISLLSTTKTPTIKKLEIDAFYRVIRNLSDNKKTERLLEVGCGNGHNLFGLKQLLPNLRLQGVDYSEEMIEAAQKINHEKYNSEIEFSVADALKIPNGKLKSDTYDFVITNRMLINLNSWTLQQEALRNIVELLNPNGSLIIIENFVNSYANQNTLRELIGLPNRVPDSYNKFLDENLFEKFASEEIGLKIMKVDNFASLHDILLYVLLPHINSGTISYDHPLMNTVTELLVNLPNELSGSFGSFGQNNLYVLRRA
jgi:ubiquinone/menaquinone biosynthesis C-methylase UbiE